MSDITAFNNSVTSLLLKASKVSDEATARTESLRAIQIDGDNSIILSLSKPQFVEMCRYIKIAASEMHGVDSKIVLDFMESLIMQVPEELRPGIRLFF